MWNFDKKVKMYKICPKNKVKPILDNIYFENGFAYACNDKMAVRNKINEISPLKDWEIEKLEEKMINGDIFKDILKNKRIEIFDDKIVGDNDAVYPFCTKGRYPKIRKIFEETIKAEKLYPSDIVMNPNMLSILSESLYFGEYVHMEFRKNNVHEDYTNVLISPEFIKSECLGILVVKMGKEI